MARRPSPALANAVAPGVRAGRIESLQARVAGNRWRFVGFMTTFILAIAVSAAVTVMLLAALAAFALALEPGSALAGRVDSPGAFAVRAGGAGFVLALVATTAWSLYRLGSSELRLLDRLGARIVPGGSLLDTKSTLRDMSLAAGLPRVPQLYVIDTPGVNAFVLGRSIERVRIGVTSGLLERIDTDCQRAVFANLIARVVTLDTLWATAVSALVGPIWKMRERDFQRDPRFTDDRESGTGQISRARTRDAAMTFLGSFFAYGLAVIVTELLAWYHREAAWTAAEKNDAEGMLLLRDPRSMLRAIEQVLERNNHVPAAGDAYSQLFFCWAGFGFAPEDDPEMRRIARLREALGAEGAAYVPRPNVPGWPSAPRAPRIDLIGSRGDTPSSDVGGTV
ncbi:MAG: M48 family metalloprotease [Coriobacteriia bacterium]